MQLLLHARDMEIVQSSRNATLSEQFSLFTPFSHQLYALTFPFGSQAMQGNYSINADELTPVADEAITVRLTEFSIRYLHVSLSTDNFTLVFKPALNEGKPSAFNCNVISYFYFHSVEPFAFC